MKKILTTILLGAALCLSAVPAFAADQAKDSSPKTTIYVMEKYTVCQDDSAFGEIDKDCDGKPDSPGMVEFFYAEGNPFLLPDNVTCKVENLQVQYIDINKVSPEEMHPFDVMGLVKADYKVSDISQMGKKTFSSNLPIRGGTTNYTEYDTKTNNLYGSVMMWVNPENAIYNEHDYISENDEDGRPTWSWYVPLKITADVERINK